MRVKLPKPVAAIYKAVEELDTRTGADLSVAGANFLTRNEGQIHRHLPSPGDLRVGPWAPLTRAPEQGRGAARSELAQEVEQARAAKF